MKGIVLFGSDEQKERFLPDLASGRKLAAFALTEPNAGSDAYHVQSRAVQQPDGSWVLNGEKRYIGNGSRAGVLVTFARAEVDGEDKHIALILEQGMEGLEVGERYDTMGLRANDLRPCTSRTCACRTRTCSASQARASGSRCTSSTTGACHWAPDRLAGPSAFSTWRSSM
jgi:acyl-CoA dehydrogenase family member 9